ncbi:MAG: hypothetical protein LBV00_07410, partial [Propionibacteriaceae bacterium]|nr:hypothetical protein [Propionibacteriaceae bacterium]
QILDGWGARVGHAVSTAASLLDAEMIIFSGPMWPHLRERFMTVVPPVIAQWPYPSVHGVSLVESTLGENAGAIGAGCLVLDRALSPQPQSLLLA